jgi:hypothetical protein
VAGVAGCFEGFGIPLCWVFGCGGHILEGEERVCAVVAFIHAAVTKAPFAFIAEGAGPVPGVCVCVAHVAEDACLVAGAWVFGCACCAGLEGGGCWLEVLLCLEDVRWFVVGWVATRRLETFIFHCSGPAEAEPVVAAFGLTVAAEAEVVAGGVAFCAGVVDVILDVCRITAATG